MIISAPESALCFYLLRHLYALIKMEPLIFICYNILQVVSVKVIRNKQTNISEGYGFIEFANRAAAERTLTTYNGTLMPQTEQAFRLNWATLGAGQRRQDDTPDYTIFVGDLAADVTDVMLQDAFRTHYTSVKGAKVITDHTTGRSKGYGFVRFGDEGEQQRAMTEMNGVVLSTRPMRIGPAANKKPVSVQQKGMLAFFLADFMFSCRWFCSWNCLKLLVWCMLLLYMLRLSLHIS